MNDDFEFMEELDILVEDAENGVVNSTTSLADLISSDATITDDKALVPSSETEQPTEDTKPDDKHAMRPTIIINRRMMNYAKRSRLVLFAPGRINGQE